MTKKAYSPREQQSLKLWLELSRCSGKIERNMDGRLRQKYGQSMSRFDVLSQLERAVGYSLPIGELAGQLLVPSGNITGLLTRMEQEGLLERQQRQDDRRSVNVEATADGLALFNQMAADHAHWAADATEGLTVAEMRTLTGLLRRLRESTDNECQTERELVN